MAEKKKDPLKVQLKNVRLSFADIYKPKAFGGGDGEGDPKYSANFLIDPESREGKVNIQKMEDAIDHAIEVTDWKGKAPKFSAAKLPLRDGEDHDYDGYDGMMFVSASNSKKPRILDRDKLDVQEGDDESPYSGCYVDAIVRVWGQNNKWGKRINASLEGIRFRDDGDAFGAAPLDPDEFDDDDDDDRGSRRSSRRSRDDDGDDSRRSSRRRSRDDDDGDDDDARTPRRRGRDDDDGDDDGRSSRRSRRSRDDDDGDDDRGSRRPSRRSRDEDSDGNDDDDDGRRSRRRGRDDDDGDDRDERRSRRSRDDGERSSRRRRGRDDDDDLA